MKNRISSVDEAKRLFVDEKLSLEKVGKRMGVSRVAVHKALKKIGVDTSKKANKVVKTTCYWCGREIEKKRCSFNNSSKHFCMQGCYVGWLKSSDYNPNRMGQRMARIFVKPYVYKLFGQIDFVVHHKDGNEENNKDENLLVFPSNADHVKWHRGSKRLPCVLLDGGNIKNLTQLPERNFLKTKM
jgi:biotin operon repressor